MALSKKPVTGMKDILPQEMEIRDYVIRVIKDTYRKFGFTSIETPCMENIENLTNKQGGENEKLIFKVLKRGEKLDLAKAQTEADLSDLGMRYDLTVPLVRFYSNNSANLASPFKSLQIGPVWRADRPQRGRYRQFYQCDIDILGEPTNLAEIELITATTTCLGKLGFENFEIRINERRILKAMAEYAGFESDKVDIVFIILDKMDKIGRDGVLAELVEEGFSKEASEKYLSLFDKLTDDTEGIKTLASIISDNLPEGAAENLIKICDIVNASKTVDFKLAFDPTLVRGMGYYTGTIFEITMDEFGSSVAGGGRYDEMIGKFTGNPTPAVGFSIGFERIITILLDKDFNVPKEASDLAYLIEKGSSDEKIAEIIKEANELRANGKRVLVTMMNKNKKFQKDQLSAAGFTEFKEVFK